MRFLALALAASCAIAKPKDRGIAVFVEASPPATPVAEAFERRLARDGYRVAGAEGDASVAVRLERMSMATAPSNVARGIYALEVTKGPLLGKRVESLDADCEGLPEPVPDCHAANFLRELGAVGLFR
jgi:hypothetical protein